VPVRLVGVIMPEQTEKGKTARNADGVSESRLWLFWMAGEE